MSVLWMAVADLGITDIEYLLIQISAIKSYLSRSSHRQRAERW